MTGCLAFSSGVETTQPFWGSHWASASSPEKPNPPWEIWDSPRFNGLVSWGKLEPETIDFPMKIMGLSCKFSLKPIHSKVHIWLLGSLGPVGPLGAPKGAETPKVRRFFFAPPPGACEARLPDATHGLMRWYMKYGKKPWHHYDIQWDMCIISGYCV